MAEDTIKREDYAPITRALRGRLKVAALGLATPMVDGLMAECDNIDAIHKAREQENADMRDFCERVEQAAQARENVTLWGVDYAPLPLDADDVPIHVGDVMEWCDSGEKLTVEGIGSDVLFYIDGENAEWTAARNKHHHHEPTVEDVLREFLGACENSMMLGYPEVPQELFDRFAKRLQLAEGDAE